MLLKRGARQWTNCDIGVGRKTYYDKKDIHFFIFSCLQPVIDRRVIVLLPSVIISQSAVESTPITEDKANTVLYVR